MPTPEARRRALRLFATRGPKKLRRVPRAQLPRLEQMAYQRNLMALLDQIDDLFDRELVTQLPRLIAQARAERERASGQDPHVHAARAAAEHHIRMDAASDDVGARADLVRIQVERLMGDNRLRVVAEQTFQGVAAQSRRQLVKQAEQVIGVQPFIREPWLNTASKAFVRENVQLITEMTRAQLAKTERIVLEGVRRGVRHEEIASQLGKMRGVSERKAALIARDQVGKALGELNKLRQNSLGLTRYIWRTVGDDKVRDEHREREGEIFEWDAPPEDGHPGEPINCRCTAEPVFDDLFSPTDTDIPVERVRG